LALVALSALVAACGGGSDTTRAPVAATAFSSSARAVLSGDWSGPYPYFLVRDAQHWSQAWAERSASIDCSLSQNAAACQSGSPPAVDFTRFMVIGVYLGQSWTFSKRAQPIDVFRQATGLVV